MNTKRMAVIGFALLVVIMLAACAPKTQAPAVVSQPAVVETAPAGATAAVDAAAPVATATVDMKAFIESKIAGNHSIDRVLNAHKTREEWNTTLDRMIGYGAKINDQEKKMIIDYLLSR
jgi:hypothetical protein